MRLAPKLLWSKQTSPCPISLPAYLFHQSLPAVLPLRNKPWSSCQTLSISTEQSLWVLLYVLLYKQHSSLCLFPSQCRACQPVLGQKELQRVSKNIVMCLACLKHNKQNLLRRILLPFLSPSSIPFSAIKSKRDLTSCLEFCAHKPAFVQSPLRSQAL